MRGLITTPSLALTPPAVLPYEQGLLNGKWVVGFDGKKKMVRRMGADGSWKVTPLGANYFKYNRDSYEVEFPVRLARPVSNAKGKRTGWLLDRTTFEYMKGGPEGGRDFTVGKVKSSSQASAEAPSSTSTRK